MTKDVHNSSSFTARTLHVWVIFVTDVPVLKLQIESHFLKSLLQFDQNVLFKYKMLNPRFVNSWDVADRKIRWTQMRDFHIFSVV